MKLKIRVLPINKPAADGSIVSRRVLEEYLQSPTYKHSVESRSMLSYLTHRGRSLATLPSNVVNPSITKVVGRDDMGNIVEDGCAPYTHVITRLYIVDNPLGDGTDWLYADADILDENLFDERAAENIKRLKGYLKSGIKMCCSCVLVGMWSGNNQTILERLKNFKGVDLTSNPSWGEFAQITDVYEDGDNVEAKEFSVTEESHEGELFVKTFSVAGFEELANTPKTSKINGQFTKLAVKQFSCASCVSEVVEEEVREFSGDETKDETKDEQKEFTVAGIKDRLRESKYSPRMYFRRIYLSYKQMLKSGNLSEEDIRILKSMFTSDVLYILNKIQPDILAGKQINTLLGCSSLSASCRKASQQLQMPFRLAMQEVNRQGYLSKTRYQKLQDAYIEFVHALIDDVFGPKVEDVIVAPASDAVRKMGEK